MFKKLIAMSLIATTTLTSNVIAENGVEINQPSKGSDAIAVGLGGGLAAGVGVGGVAAALSAAGIAAVPHAAGGMILISTATGASYIAGTLGLIGGAAACAASVVCGAAVVGGAALAIGGGYFAYEAIKSKPIEFDDVIKEDENLFYAGNHYVRIRDKYLTSEKRDDLKEKAAKDEFRKDYYVVDGVMIYWGLLNDDYYVSADIAKELKSQFESGGLYEMSE